MKHIAVLGAGTMGTGIAHVAALAGYQTNLVDSVADQLVKAKDRIAADLSVSVEKGKITDDEKGGALERLDTFTNLKDAVARADLVIEAVPERLELKIELLDAVCEAAPEQHIFATNTSSLPVSEIASAHPVPSSVIGMHFFNPVHIMKLLEIVRAEQTSDDTLKTVQEVGQRMNRDMIVVRDAPGFATSRLGLVIGLEAMRMLESGVASAEDIDRAMELGYRHPMGPLRLTDLVGLDVRLAIAEHLHKELGEAFRPPPILRRMVRAGHLGKKSGRGFYNWSD